MRQPDNYNYMQTTLPVEVIELIVDKHGLNSHQAESRDALRSLALVSSYLCIRAYKYLFAELDIFLVLGMPDVVSLTLQCQRTCQRLRNVLTEGVKFPRIAMVYRLQTVSITICGGVYQSLQNFCMSSELTELLKALHGPTHGISAFKFEMKPATGPSFDCPYPLQRAEMFNPESYNALANLCKSSRLESLSLVGVVLGSHSLYGAQAKQLYLRRFRFEWQEEDDMVNQSTYPPDPTTIYHPLFLTAIISDGFLSKLTDVFQPHVYYQIPPWSLTQLKSLTLSAMDVGAEINLMPQLQSLKLLQKYDDDGSESISSSPLGFTRTLYDFLMPKQGAVRDLGPISVLTIEIQVHTYQEFLIEHEPEAIRTGFDHQDLALYSQLVDSVLIARPNLQHIAFLFKFYSDSEFEQYIPFSDHPEFIQNNRRIILGLFPRLASSSLFSLDIGITHMGAAIGHERETTVRCKGSGPGWW